jgi:hypothetical protein
MESNNGSHKAQSRSKPSAADDIPQAVNKNVSNTKAYIKGKHVEGRFLNRRWLYSL